MYNSSSAYHFFLEIILCVMLLAVSKLEKIVMQWVNAIVESCGRICLKHGHRENRIRRKKHAKSSLNSI